MTIPARYNHTQQMHVLRANVAYNTPGIAGGIQIGTVPRGARLRGLHVYVDTAFNAATTNVLAAGTAATGTQLADGTATAAGTTGYKTVTTGNALTFASDTPIYVSYAQTGTAATAGAATFILEFFPDMDVNGTYTPAG